MDAGRSFTREELRQELMRQRDRLFELGYGEVTGSARTRAGEELRTAVYSLVYNEFGSLVREVEDCSGEIPILLVVPERFAPLPHQAMLARLDDQPIRLRQGILMELRGARWDDDCAPSDLPYLLLDVRMSDGTDEVVERYDHPRWGTSYVLGGAGPVLSVVEGLALATHYPECMPDSLALPGTLGAMTSEIASIHRNTGEAGYRLATDSHDYARRSFNGRVAYCARRIPRHVGRTL